MKLKNIVFNTWNGAFFQKGGGEVQLLQSKYALERRGLNVHLFNMWDPQTEVDVLHQFSIQAGVEHVVKRYKDRGIKIALSTILWYLHDKDSYEYRQIEYILKTSDIYFTNSDAESLRLANHYQLDLSKFHKTRNSISSSYFKKAEGTLFREKYGISGDFILSVANIDRRKNFEGLVQACKKLGVKLIGIGHMQDKAYFEEFKDIHKGYQFLGPIEDEEMLRSAYSSCSIYALPSFCETPGIAALEAASQGAKIVITSEGCAQEYFGDFATYVNPYDVESIAEGLGKAIITSNKPGLEAYIRENFNWDVTATEILKGYEKICN